MESDSLPPSDVRVEQQENNGDEEPERKLAKAKCNELLSSLPTNDDWHKGMPLYQYQGFWLPRMSLEGLIWAQQSFRAQESDVIIATGPKTGTTWIKALVFAIVTRNRYNDQDINNKAHPLLMFNPHVCVPFIEFLMPDLTTTSLDLVQTPRLLSTHIPYNSLPESIVDSGSKIVYLSRNPKDVFVSFYCFLKELTPEDRMLTVEEMVDLFCRGTTTYGPYWDHVLAYWSASLERPDKILFLKYEDLKADTEGIVNKLAEFIGFPFSPEEESSGAVRDIVKLCSIETLAKLEVNQTGKFGLGDASHIFKMQNRIFFRKGEVGDFRNFMTADMIQRLDQITDQKFAGSGMDLHKA